jgi:hypothetical protein
VIIVGTCAVVDAAAGLTLWGGADIVQKCGVAKMLGFFELIAWLGFGTIPIGIALVAVAAAFLIPELRRPRLWVFSAALLTLLAIGVVAAAQARYPTPTQPAVCDV